MFSLYYFEQAGSAAQQMWNRISKGENHMGNTGCLEVALGSRQFGTNSINIDMFGRIRTYLFFKKTKKHVAELTKSTNAFHPV